MAQDSGEVIPAADTERLRAQIEETRTEMSETIDAIQDRLRPGRLMTDAKASVKEATVGRVRDCLLYTSPSPRDRQKSRMPSSA